MATSIMTTEIVRIYLPQSELELAAKIKTACIEHGVSVSEEWDKYNDYVSLTVKKEVSTEK